MPQPLPSTPDGLTWHALAIYHMAPTLEDWAIAMDQDPFSPTTVQAYDLVHAAYARLWLAMGDAFHERIWLICERVGRLELANTRVAIARRRVHA